MTTGGNDMKCRVLELYSGIGGMHCALKSSGIMSEVVAAIDVNTTANKIYTHNFPETRLIDCGIESLTVRQLDSMKIDMILMSPPCQPFTRVGKKQDSKDVRTKSFLHLLSLLPRLQNCPRYILVENVKGFEESDTCSKLQETLRQCNFHYQEFMLTPLQFGIPNSRLRYFMIAKKKSLKFCFQPSDKIMTEVPQSFHNLYIPTTSKGVCSNKKLNSTDTNFSHSNPEDGELKEHISVSNCTEQVCSVSQENDGNNYFRNICSANDSIPHKTPDMVCELCGVNCLQNYGHNMRQIQDDDSQFSDCLMLYHFLEDKPLDFFHSYLLNEKDLKRFIVMDIVFPCLKKTTCFTKRYGHFMEGAGSIVQMSTDFKHMIEVSSFKDQTMELKNRDQWNEEEYELLSKLQLRYFTPREIANLLCFPSEYVILSGLFLGDAWTVCNETLQIPWKNLHTRVVGALFYIARPLNFSQLVYESHSHLPYFVARKFARLFGETFPEDISHIQLYRALGNSLNVHVVTTLIQVLMTEICDDVQS